MPLIIMWMFYCHRYHAEALTTMERCSAEAVDEGMTRLDIGILFPAARESYFQPA